MKTKLTLSLLFIVQIAFAQINKTFIDTGHVTNQFDYLMSKSNRFEDYKVVKINWLKKLQSNVTDSLMASRKLISEKATVIQTQQTSIDDLNTSLNSLKARTQELESQTTHISWLG